jgi:hypothetical protein
MLILNNKIERDAFTSLRRAIQQILIMHVKKGGRACARAICSGAQTAAEHAPLRTHPESFGHGARIRTRQFKKCRASSHRDSDEMRATCGMILRVNCLFLRPETGLIQLLIIKRFSLTPYKFICVFRGVAHAESRSVARCFFD